MEASDLETFVESNTSPQTLQLVPEITLHLATELVPLWERTEALGARNPPPPYWAFAWPGGQALARYILDNTGKFSGKSVLDFGAGSGLVAIAAARAGAVACAAEIDPFAIAAIARNAGVNGVTVSIAAGEIAGRDDGWDTVCLGDMCYERQLAERLLPWVHALARRGARILLGDPGRDYFSSSGMRPLATYRVATNRELEDREARETTVYELQPNK